MQASFHSWRCFCQWAAVLPGVDSELFGYFDKLSSGSQTLCPPSRDCRPACVWNRVSCLLSLCLSAFLSFFSAGVIIASHVSLFRNVFVLSVCLYHSICLCVSLFIFLFHCLLPCIFLLVSICLFACVSLLIFLLHRLLPSIFLLVFIYLFVCLCLSFFFTVSFPTSFCLSLFICVSLLIFLLHNLLPSIFLLFSIYLFVCLCLPFFFTVSFPLSPCLSLSVYLFAYLCLSFFFTVSFPTSFCLSLFVYLFLLVSICRLFVSVCISFSFTVSLPPSFCLSFSVYLFGCLCSSFFIVPLPPVLPPFLSSLTSHPLSHSPYIDISNQNSQTGTSNNKHHLSQSLARSPTRGQNTGLNLIQYDGSWPVPAHRYITTLTCHRLISPHLPSSHVGIRVS